MMTHFLGTVEFDAHRALPDLSADLKRVCAIPLIKDESGRFDEVPTYLGNCGEVQFTLFGPAEGQGERECILEVSYRSPLNPKQAQGSAIAFLQPVFDGVEVDSTGHIDCSAQLSNLLIDNGFGDCRPVHRAN